VMTRTLSNRVQLNRAPDLAGEAWADQGAAEHVSERTHVRKRARAEGNAGMTRSNERVRCLLG
jgi:hypothetical protein